jgi:hypothetical protein
MYDRKGDVLVHLYAPSSGRGPSFKVPQHIFADSAYLVSMLLSSSQDMGRESYDGSNNSGVSGALASLTINAPGTPPRSPDQTPVSASSNESLRSFTDESGARHFFFPTGLSPDVVANPTAEDVMRLIDVRNLFGFLTAQKLVFTRQRPNLFHALMGVGELLRAYGFSNMTGESFGEAASHVLGFYIEVEHMGDVRNDPEDIVRTIVLGERLRSVELYNEAFAHAVGRYTDLKETDSRTFALISTTTQQRLERAYLELSQRQKSVDIRLDAFEFPSIFAGIAASTSSDESKFINFKQWKNGYLVMRKFVMSYYKDLHGQWPPKGSSKKNSFVEGGLNRLVLKGLYHDLSQLYDLLVDRESVTTRAMNASDDQDTSNINPRIATLRRILGEYDRSSPPVQPPIPFDVPLLPTIETLNPRFQMLPTREQTHAYMSKLPANEVILIMTKSHNLYRKEESSPFLDAFEAFERGETLGKSCAELECQRIGHWIFLYAVIQSLPLLVIDAPGVRYTEGVEYFLCQPSLGNLPWLDDAVALKKEWYTSKTGGIIHMPADIVNHGVEAVYRRSHCWTVATKWMAPSELSNSSTYAEEITVPPTISEQGMLSPLAPPPGFGDGDYGLAPNPGPSSGSLQRSPDGLPVSSSIIPNREGRRNSRQNYRSSIGFLEKLPIPTGTGSPDNFSPSPMSSTRAMSAGSGMTDRRTSTMSGTPSSVTSKEHTFDDILKNINYDQPQKKKKSDKKK